MRISSVDTCFFGHHNQYLFKYYLENVLFHVYNNDFDDGRHESRDYIYIYIYIYIYTHLYLGWSLREAPLPYVHCLPILVWD